MNTAQSFFADLSTGDVAAALARTTLDFTWTVAGVPGQGFALAGTYDRERFAAMLSRVAAALPDGPHVEITSVTPTAERIVVETHTTGRSARGLDYDNRIAYVFDLRDGRICSVREYLDTIHAAEIFTQ
ncbi:nuclear transport factor 2 family protein [Mycolicibacterium sp. 120266]|uniref:nuclear transport factor 2 family protein n=1 Tax=Mycolicibacterium sp. 120266 TaxID=3090601 RepID=UPI00299D51FA|nr:nuclear transport factor 2 family protein [Mycolicibacterium sp. 120266]MDX1873270.1 nuclear transport factor 2 family protein [Mycolicibacterium sp. 120266]